MARSLRPILLVVAVALLLVRARLSVEEQEELGVVWFMPAITAPRGNYVNAVPPVTPAEPWAVHISLGADPTSQVTVMWSTTGMGLASTVVYGTQSGALSQTASGTQHQYDVVPLYSSPALHVVPLSGLSAGTQYFYQCGALPGNLSDEFSFWTAPAGGSDVHWVAFGDNGHAAESYAVLEAMRDFANASAHGRFDLLTLSGDISYANLDEPVWDIYQYNVQPFTAGLPWMLCPGNHELLDAFQAYQNRFAMPANGLSTLWTNQFYTFPYGAVQFVFLDSEAFFYDPATEQYQWLVAALKKVDRTVTPWIVAHLHSPFYTTNTVHTTSGDDIKQYFERVLHEAGVDLVINGHIHAYERTALMWNGAESSPSGTAYITCGTGGNEEGLYHNWLPLQPWSLSRSAEFGFSVLYANTTHLHQSFVAAVNGTVLDEMWLCKVAGGREICG